jgi:hypothetical protein
MFSVQLALGRGQRGVGLPHPQVHLPAQQHLLLLLSLPHRLYRCREVLKFSLNSWSLNCCSLPVVP